MAGNRTTFEAAMKRAAEHAWNQHWDQALADYQRAADEFPDDMAARGNLALAFYRLGNWESALVHYSWMLEHAPENAFIMDRLIEVYLKLERRSEAKKMQARLEALNQRQRTPTNALPATTNSLSTATGALPTPPAAPQTGGLDVGAGDGRSVKRPRQLADAPRQTTGSLAATAGDQGRATGDLKQTTGDLRPVTGDLRPVTGDLRPATRSLSPAPAAAAASPGRGEGMLTNQLTAFELNEMVALAMAYEESGKIGEAIRHYEQAIAAGIDRPEAFYSLGLLFQQQGRHQEALALFARCLDDADYAMSATFGTGVSQRALGQRHDGARMLSLAISLIDHDQIGTGEAGELISIYRTAIEALTDIENYLQASNLASSLADYLAPRDGYAAVSAEFREQSQRLQARLTTSLKPTDASAPDPALSAAGPPPSPPASRRPAAPLLDQSAAIPAVAPPEPPPALPTAPVLATPPPAPTATPAEPTKRQRPAARSRAAVAPMPDEEAPERLTTTYRRVTGAFGQEKRGTGSLGGAPKPPTGPLSGETRRVTGPLTNEQPPATGELSRTGTGALGGSKLLVGRTTTILAERTTMLLTDRTPAGGSLRRRRLHAHTGPLAGVDGQPAEVRALIDEAEANAAAGHVIGAIDACRAVVGLATGFIPIYLRLAELHGRRGELGIALDTAQAALRVLNGRNASAAERLPFLRLIVRLRPTDEAALSAYSETAHQAGQAAIAAPLIRRLVARLLARGATSRTLTEAERLAGALPDDLLARLTHADTLTMLGQPEPALDLYRSALTAAPGHVRAIAGANITFAMLAQDGAWWSSLESLLEAAGRGRPAGKVSLRLYRKLAASPVASRIQAAAGLLTLALGRPQAALAWLDPLVTGERLDARLHAVVLHAAALIAAAMGDAAAEREHRVATLTLMARPEVAAALAPLALFDHPLTISCLGVALADMHVRQGSLNEAIQALDQLRRAAPGDEAILTRLADLHLQAGRLGAALAALDELVSHHRDAGRLDQMAAVLDRMSQLAPNNVGVKTKLIDAYLERGFVEQARRELELRAQLLASGGKIAGAVASLQKASGICWTMGRHDEAFVLSERMIALQPANADSRQYLITLYLQAGQLDRAVVQTWELASMYITEDNHRDAIAALHQIIGLAPDDARAYHRLGEALAAIGDYAQAEKVYERLARYAPDDAVARARKLTMASLAGQRSSVAGAA